MFWYSGTTLSFSLIQFCCIFPLLNHCFFMPVSPLPKQSALATGSILPSVICCRSYGITSPAQEVNLTSVISACKGLVLLRLPSIFICTFQKLWLQKFASRLPCEKDREEHIIIQLIILNHFLQHPQISSSFLCPSFPLFIFKELFSVISVQISSEFSTVYHF